jgi:hypothetical protein
MGGEEMGLEVPAFWVAGTDESPGVVQSGSP